MSCTEIRTRLPAFRTLPSRSVATFSFSPITARSSFLPLNWNEDARAATRSPRIFVSTLSSSSARPSAKYSSSSPRLRFTKGSTAIEGASFVPAGVDEGCTDDRDAEEDAGPAGTVAA